jgi:hypothetical protein
MTAGGIAPMAAENDRSNANYATDLHCGILRRAKAQQGVRQGSVVDRRFRRDSPCWAADREPYIAAHALLRATLSRAWQVSAPQICASGPPRAANRDGSGVDRD